MENKKVEVPIWAVASGIVVIAILVILSAFLIGRGVGVKEAYASKPNSIDSYEKNIGYNSFNEQENNFSKDTSSVNVNPSSLLYNEESGNNYVSDSNNKSLNKAHIAQVSDNEKEQVRSFFVEVESVLESGKTWSDPNAAAESMLKSIMSGDSSEMDDMINNLRSITDRLNRINAPNPCCEYKSKLITTMQYSSSIMEKVKKAIQDSDITTLQTLTNDAEKLKRVSADTDKMMEEIKARYGIK